MADQEALPFKTIYSLCNEGLRLHITPEAGHTAWNNVKNAIRRSSLQHTMLLASVLSNCSHGPFRSGRNLQTLQEASHSFAAKLRSSDELFDGLVELMLSDRRLFDTDFVQPDEIPESADDIPGLHCINHFPVFAPLPQYINLSNWYDNKR